MGIGALSFSYTGAADTKPLVENYYAILEKEGKPLTPTLNPNMLITAGDLMVAGSREEAVDRIGLGIGFHGYGIRHYYVSGRHHPGRTGVWEQYNRSLLGQETGDAQLLAQSMADEKRADWQALALANAKKTSDAHGGVGSVDEVREQLLGYEQAGLELLGRHVLPEFVDREHSGRAERDRRLAPIIEGALARHERVFKDVDPDYRFGGVPQAWDGATRASEVEDAMKAAAAARAGAST
jgi:hypothetical protein